MELSGSSGLPASNLDETASAQLAASGWQSVRPLRVLDVQVYRLCEDLTEVLIYLMVVFTPWAFGTTQPWSIWTMNIAGYVLGLLLMSKLFIRRAKGYHPPRLDYGTTGLRDNRIAGFITAQKLTKALALITVALLLYCLTAALNARSTYQPEGLAFTPREHLKWLPASFDSARSWFTPNSG